MGFFYNNKPDSRNDWQPAFNPGDLVRLKSGGPAMTVRFDRSGGWWPEVAAEIGKDCGVYCTWYDGNMHDKVFDAEQLEPERAQP